MEKSGKSGSGKPNKKKEGPGGKDILRRGFIILFWLCVWQLAAVITHNDILLVGPVRVAGVLFQHMKEADFLRIIFYSSARIGLGFFAALVCGVLLGASACRYAWLEEFFAPVMAVLKSVPVASFVVLLLIWSGSGSLSFFISFLIVFPNVYVNTTAGLKSTDKKLLEMSRVLGMSGRNRIWFLYRPALMPYLRSSLKISLGMSWKSGVAAEVIGMPAYSLGGRIYLSKIYLDTAGLFAWTLMVILLSFLFEKAVLYLLKRLEDWKPYPAVERRAERWRKWEKRQWNRTGKGKGLTERRKKKRQEAEVTPPEIAIRNVCKAYGKQQVLSDFSMTMRPGGRYCLMAPSGAGKTTLLSLLNRTVLPDAGTIEGAPERIGMVFQEDRLCGEYDVAANILLTYRPDAGYKRGASERNRVAGAEERAIGLVRAEAAKILPAECLTKAVNKLSGGMKRRCAILRAMFSGAELIVMDEPFAGLDEENRERTAAYILENLNGRTLLVTTHRAEDAELLDGKIVTLKEE